MKPEHILNTRDLSDRRSFRFFDLIMALFVTVLILSNILSSAKLISFGFSVSKIPVIVDAGTILFPISYIFGDVLTEVYGFRRSRRVIWTGFSLLAFSSLIILLMRVLPGAPSWESSGGRDAYDMAFSGMFSGGIVIASLVAYWIGEFSNSVILAKLKVRTRGRWLWLRTITSTLVGEGLDSLIFILIATALGVFLWSDFVSLVLTNYVLKVLIEVGMTPITYQIIRKLKKAEQEDYYDTHTRFSPI